MSQTGQDEKASGIVIADLQDLTEITVEGEIKTTPAPEDVEVRAAGATRGWLYFLRNKATGFYLDSNAQRQVYTHAYNGGSYQKWDFFWGGYGWCLRDLATGFVLDSNARRQVYTLPHNGGSYQQWKLLSGTDGYYVLQNVATGFVLDSNASRQVYTLGWNGGSYQQWGFAGASA